MILNLVLMILKTGRLKKCETPYCRNQIRNRRYCHTCRSKQSRQRDKVRAAFTNLKSNAKRRKKEFEITLDQFRAWCTKVKYIGHCTRSPEGYTIDRINNQLGYTLDNIQVLTRSDNVKKYFQYDYQTKFATYLQ